MARLFRSMRSAAGGGPKIEPAARGLGVRPGIDVVATAADELVRPGEGGISIAPDDPKHLPVHRRPPSLHGTGSDPVWWIEEGDLGPDLVYRPDPARAGHGFVEPAREMILQEF